jgi:cyclohexanone monooxygenase
LWSSIVPDENIVAFEKSALEVSAEERKAVFERAWAFGGYALHRSFRDILSIPEASDLVNEFIREKIAEVVKDPKTADLLTPRHYYGVKRVILDTDYYEMFNRPNVTLVDVKSDPIVDMTATGIRTGNAFYEVDMIVLATGFDAMTGSLTRMDIRGRGGRKLGDDWKHGPRTYLGIMAAGFPNMFMIGGPQSCSALANVITANEQQVDWIAECISRLDEDCIATIETTDEAQDGWVEHVNALADKTIFTKGDSWYLGSNIPGKPRAFLLYAGGFPAYREHTENVAENGYEGFVLSPAG